MLVRGYWGILSRIKVWELVNSVQAIKDLEELLTLVPYSSRSSNWGLLKPKFSSFFCEDIYEEIIWEINCGGI